jgi:uncharacterized membrane protein YgcG
MKSIRILPLLALLSLLSGCKVTEMNSLRTDREIVIDGSDSEWSGALVSLEKVKVSVGFYNDAQFLYLCLVPMDPSKLSAILNQGLYVWFDAKAGGDKTFGIGFPTGMLERGFIPPRIGKNADSLEIARLQKTFDFFQDEMELRTPGSNAGKWESLHGVPGVEAKAGFGTGRFVYELKVPLTTDNGRFPYAVGIDTSRVISVGFETPESDRDAEIGPRPSASSSAGSSGSGGGGGGRGSRGRGGSRGVGGSQDAQAEQPGPGIGAFSGPDPVNLWIKLRLAG